MPEQTLGGRLPLLDPASLEGEQKTLYDAISATMVPWAEKAGFASTTADGRLIGPFNAVLLSPAIGQAFLALQKAEGEHTALDERTRQVVILTVGAVWKAPYELYAHTAVARQAGLAPSTIEALASGQPAEDLGEAERIAQRFTWQLTAERRVDDGLYREAAAAFGPKGLVDIIMLAGCYHVVCALLNAFDVPAPGPGLDPRKDA